MLAAFLAGAAAYPMVELAWRGRTHPAMALAGGVSLSMLRGLSRVQKSRPLWQQALLGGLMITGMEYAFGLAFNRRHQIWDYRRMPANLRGQICLPFTLAWGILTAAAVWWIQPWVERLASRIPPEATFFCLLLFTADALLSARFLWVTGDIEGLRSLS